MPSLLELNRDILDALRQLAFDSCCHDIPFSPQPDQTTDLTPHEGPAPETWGSEPVADWDDWELLVCGAAGAWVDLQVDNARVMQELLDLVAITMSVIVGFFFLISLTPISLATAATIWSGLASLYGTQVFEQSAVAMESNRSKLICAIKEEYAHDLRGTMEEILPPLAWNFWYRFMAYENVVATIWEGKNPNTGDLTVYREGCPDCAELMPPADFAWAFEFSNEGWTASHSGVLTWPYSGSDKELSYATSNNSDNWAQSPNLRGLLGYGAGVAFKITAVRITFRRASSGTIDTQRLAVLYGGTAVFTEEYYNGTGPYSAVELFKPTLAGTTETNVVLRLRHQRTGGGGNNVIYYGLIEVWAEPA
jgi:hypothetical protein